MQTRERIKQTITFQSVPTLANLWKSQVRNCGFDVKTLTPKEFGQLKNLNNLLGDLTGELITRVLQDWFLFRADAAVDAGLSSSPCDPHIGFLSAHVFTALNFTRSLAKHRNIKSAVDIEFIRKTGEALGLGKPDTEVQGVKAAPKLLEEETTPQPSKHVPIQVGFTDEQWAVLASGEMDKRYRKFMTAIGEKYGEDCVINGGFCPGKGQILCDIPI